jgi:hypothetical protein
MEALLPTVLGSGGSGASAAGSNGQLQYNNAGAFGGVSTMTFDGTSVTLAGRLINSYTSVASSPAKVFTGIWFTGGTATTTKPHFLIEPTGTTSTNWNTSGTGLGVNAASGFAGNLLDLQVNGSSLFRVNNSGYPVFANYISTSGTSIRVTRNGNFSSGAEVISYMAIDGMQVRSGWGLGWATGDAGNSSSDLVILRDAANTLAQRNGTSAQVFRVYNTYTSSTNYELGKLEWSSNAFRIGTEKVPAVARHATLSYRRMGRHE